jgi:hypothetical protein
MSPFLCTRERASANTVKQVWPCHPEQDLPSKRVRASASRVCVGPDDFDLGQLHRVFAEVAGLA